MNLEAFTKSHPNTPVVLMQGLGFAGSIMSLVEAGKYNTERIITASAVFKYGNIG
jgi:hypothetical protein